MSINEAEKKKLITELEQFLKRFVSYKELAMAEKSGIAVVPGLEPLRLELERKYAKLKAVIEEYGGSTEVLLEGGKRKCEAFISAFSYTQFGRVAFDVVMDTAIAAINTAIGNLESLMLPETGQLQSPEDSSEIANFLFDKMQFHPKVVKASKSRFESGHYSDAIFAAFKAVNNFVKQKTGLPTDGKGLMMEAFSKNNPIIKLNEGRTDSDKDEQEGFMHLFAGAMQGIRNPKAHDEVAELNMHRTLEYLAFASLLMRRAGEGVVKRARKKQPKSLKS